MATAGELLKGFREAKGLSQPKLAELAGTSDQQISRLELGQRRLTEKWRRRLAPSLGIDPDDLDPTSQSPIKRSAIRLIEGMSDAEVRRLMPLLHASSELVKAAPDS